MTGVWPIQDVPFQDDEGISHDALVKRKRIHWAWVPAAVFLTVSTWVRYGVLGALAGLAIGVALIGLGEYQSRRRSRP